MITRSWARMLCITMSGTAHDPSNEGQLTHTAPKPIENARVPHKAAFRFGVIKILLFVAMGRSDGSPLASAFLAMLRANCVSSSWVRLMATDVTWLPVVSAASLAAFRVATRAFCSAISSLGSGPTSTSSASSITGVIALCWAACVCLRVCRAGDTEERVCLPGDAEDRVVRGTGSALVGESVGREAFWAGDSARRRLAGGLTTLAVDGDLRVGLGLAGVDAVPFSTDERADLRAKTLGSGVATERGSMIVVNL